MTENMEHRLVIGNEVAELKKLPQFLEGVFRDCPLDGRECMRLRSGLDEALTNCVFYAYDAPGTGRIEVSASWSGDRLTFMLKDAGKPFNPVEYNRERPDQLTVGGLGISVYKAIFDEVAYSREDGSNILKLIKNTVI